MGWSLAGQLLVAFRIVKRCAFKRLLTCMGGGNVHPVPSPSKWPMAPHSGSEEPREATGKGPETEQDGASPLFMQLSSKGRQLLQPRQGKGIPEGGRNDGGGDGERTEENERVA